MYVYLTPRSKFKTEKCVLENRKNIEYKKTSKTTVTYSMDSGEDPWRLFSLWVPTGERPKASSLSVTIANNV